MKSHLTRFRKAFGKIQTPFLIKLSQQTRTRMDPLKFNKGSKTYSRHHSQGLSPSTASKRRGLSHPFLPRCSGSLSQKNKVTKRKKTTEIAKEEIEPCPCIRMTVCIENPKESTQKLPEAICLVRLWHPRLVNKISGTHLLTSESQLKTVLPKHHLQ